MSRSSMAQKYRISRERRPKLEQLEDRLLLYHTYFDQGSTNAYIDKLPVTYSYSNLLTNWGSGLTNDQMVAAVQEAMGMWASTSTLKFEELPDAGPAVSDNNYSVLNGPRIRFGQHDIVDPVGSNTLAHSYQPEANNPGQAFEGRDSDVHFDSSDAFSLGLFLEVATHEVGHAVGMAHANGDVVNGVFPPPTGAIMDAVATNRFSASGTAFLTDDDRLGVTSLYGAGLGYVLNSAGELSVYGTANVDAFTVDVSSGNITVTNAEASSWGTRSFTRSLTGVSSLHIHGQDGNDSLTIQNNDPNLTITFSGDGGNDSFLFQSGTTDLDNKAATYFFDGGAGVDSASVDDRYNSVSRIYSVTDHTVGRFAGSTVFNLDYNASVESMALVTGLVRDTVSIFSTRAGSTTTISNTIFGDDITIGSNGTMATIQGNVDLIPLGSSNKSTVTLYDSFSTGNRTPLFTTDGTITTLVGAAPGTIRWANNGVGLVDYRLNASTHGISTNGVAAPLKMEGLGPDDVVTFVGSAVNADVELVGNPMVGVFDADWAGGRNVFLEPDGTGQRLRGFATGNIRFTTLASLGITFGDGGDAFSSSGAQSFPISIVGGDGSDTLHLNNWSNNRPGQSPYSFQYDGGSGNDVVWLSDEGRSGEFNYSIQDGLLLGSEVSSTESVTLSISNYEQVALGLNDQRNHVDVLSAPIGFDSTFTGGVFLSLNGGDDEVVIKPRKAQGMPALAGAVIIDSAGLGLDKLTIDCSDQLIGDSWTISNPNANYQDFVASGVAVIRSRINANPAANFETVQLNGSQGADSFTMLGYSNGGSISIAGNAGADAFNVGQDFSNLGNASISFDGGADNDTMSLSNIASNVAWNFTRRTANGAGGSASVLVANSASSQVQFADAAVESLNILGGQQNDVFNIYQSPAGQTLGINGWDGASQFNFGGYDAFGILHTPSEILGPVSLSNSNGVETVNIDASGQTSIARAHFNEQYVGQGRGDNLFGPGAYLNIAGLDGTLNFSGAQPGNTVYVRPSATMTLNLVAPDPVTTDSLTLALAGITGVSNPQAGKYTFANALPLNSTGFSTIATDNTAPLIIGQRVNNAASPYYEAQFSESVDAPPVSATLISGQLTDPHTIPINLYPTTTVYDDATHTIRYNFSGLFEDTLPIGSFTVFNGSDIRDVAGNPIALSFYNFSVLPAPGDYNLSGVVTAADLDAWRSHFGEAFANADGNHNGTVDAADYVVARHNYGARATVAATGSGASSTYAPPGVEASIGTIDSSAFGQRSIVQATSSGHDLSHALTISTYDLKLNRSADSLGTSRVADQLKSVVYSDRSNLAPTLCIGNDAKYALTTPQIVVDSAATLAFDRFPERSEDRTLIYTDRFLGAMSNETLSNVKLAFDVAFADFQYSIVPTSRS